MIDKNKRRNINKKCLQKQMHYISKYNTVYYIHNAINDLFIYLFATFAGMQSLPKHNTSCR